MLFLYQTLRENTICSNEKMQYFLNCSPLRKVIYEQIEKMEGEKENKEDFIKMKSIFCVWLRLWMAM